MANSLAVMFQRNEVPDPPPYNKSTEMPAHKPHEAKYMPGDKKMAKTGARAKNQPWRSWLGKKGRKHKKSTARAVMGG